MYPFERFTERAKKVLTLAQEEAERSHHSYIGTEHLLLGLLAEGQNTATKVLQSRGRRLTDVRQRVEEIIGTGPWEADELAYQVERAFGPILGRKA